ncbi:unnamed protein product [Rotaria magnacalcarata]|uniref:Uncharacterized protein n=1 Tax=Rotaria magnacalcarata TaxID=392030 RepID=A0A815ZI73_9BILA|nr:unnamed protein product [Rotaria magnacalcarata]
MYEVVTLWICEEANKNHRRGWRKGIESVAGADRTEQLANRFELIHAATNPDDTLMRYADELATFLEVVRAVNIKDLNIDPKEIQPTSLNGLTLQQVYELYGDQVKTFMKKDGRVYVRRPTFKEYYNSVKRDKPAGIHEQRKIPEVLGCEIQTGETIDSEQKCTLTRPGGSEVSFSVRDNLYRSNHETSFWKKRELEKSKRELLELKYRVFYNKPHSSLDAIETTVPILNDDDRKLKLLNKHEQLIQRKKFDFGY